VKKKDEIPIIIKIQNNDFDISKEMKKLQTNETGAIVNFVGIVRGKDEKTNEEIYSIH
jgi:molybdopterin synthase catalytic subunit